VNAGVKEIAGDLAGHLSYGVDLIFRQPVEVPRGPRQVFLIWSLDAREFRRCVRCNMSIPTRMSMR